MNKTVLKVLAFVSGGLIAAYGLYAFIMLCTEIAPLMEAYLAGYTSIFILTLYFLQIIGGLAVIAAGVLLIVFSALKNTDSAEKQIKTTLFFAIAAIAVPTILEYLLSIVNFSEMILANLGNISLDNISLYSLYMLFVIGLEAASVAYLLPVAVKYFSSNEKLDEVITKVGRIIGTSALFTVAVIALAVFIIGNLILYGVVYFLLYCAGGVLLILAGVLKGKNPAFNNSTAFIISAVLILQYIISSFQMTSLIGAITPALYFIIPILGMVITHVVLEVILKSKSGEPQQQTDNDLLLWNKK